MDWLESLVERRIREATQRGDFDNLAGAGKPLQLRDAGDPDWWIKQLARREQIEAAALLPPTLALRREADGFPDSLLDLTTPEQVRAVLLDFNERVRADWARPAVGRTLPLPARQVDVEALLAQWRHAKALLPGRAPLPESRAPLPGNTAAESENAADESDPRTPRAGTGRPTRHWHRWRRRRAR